MLKEAKKWVAQLEETLTKLSQEFNKSIEELDAEFENWYNDGGAQWDMAGSGPNAVEAFASKYRSNREEEAESEAYEEVYKKKMRAFASDRGYDLGDGEIESIIYNAGEDEDSVLDCADGALRELVDDWVDDHQI